MFRIATKYGLVLAAGLIAYFLLMQVVGLGENYNFRILNAVIHIICIWLAIKHYADQQADSWNYLTGVSTGMVTSMIGIVPFCIFVLIWLATHADLMNHLQENVVYVGSYLTPTTAALIILIEGVAVSFLASYIIMRIVDARVRQEYKP